MKKILLTLAAVFVGISAAFADADITIADAKGFTDGSVTSGWKAGDFTFTTAKNDGQTAPTFNAKGKDYRVYAKGTLAISATNDMTKIEFTISTAGLKRLAEITPSTGSSTLSNSSSQAEANMRPEATLPSSPPRPAQKPTPSMSQRLSNCPLPLTRQAPSRTLTLPA